jgi:salicylate hydroxylase
MIDKTIKWPLLSGDPSIPSWISQSGKVIMLGDAAHAMVPYMSQGAAMAVEDGAALAAALSHVHTISDLPKALSVFDIVRRRRAGQMQEASLVNGKIWHFDDGPEQAARDEAMEPETKGLPISESPNQWTDPVTQAWAYGYSAEDDIHSSWNQFKSRLF